MNSTHTERHYCDTLFEHIKGISFIEKFELNISISVQFESTNLEKTMMKASLFTIVLHHLHIIFYLYYYQCELI